MDEGLFFWLIIFAVAVLQGIGQKKKKTGKPGQRLPGSKPRGQRAPTRTRPRPTGPGTEGVDVSSDEGTSSESMIPSDVWEEILGLARGAPGEETPQRAPSEEMEETLPHERGLGPEQRQRRAPRELEPRRADSPPAAPLPASAPAPREFPASHGAHAVLHPAKPSGSEAGLGVTRSSEVRDKGTHVASVRRELFGGGTLKELRKAIVHQEVLGRPVALKEDD